MAIMKIDTMRIKNELLDWLNCNPNDVAVSTCGMKRNRWAITIRHNGTDNEYDLRIDVVKMKNGRRYSVTVEEEDYFRLVPVFDCNAMLSGYKGISDEAVIWSTVCAALKTTADWTRR